MIVKVMASRAVCIFATAVLCLTQNAASSSHAAELAAKGRTEASVDATHDSVATERRLERQLRHDPANSRTWVLLGSVRIRERRLAEAESCFRKALAFEPHLTPAQMELGRLLATQHRDREALPYLEEALRATPPSVEIRDITVKAVETVALQQRGAGDKDGALATLLAANSVIGDNFDLLLDLSIVEDELRLYRDAERAIQGARRIDPANLKALYAEARVKMDLQDIPSAESDMRAYLKARPEDATAHYGLGRILQMTQHSDGAKAEFERSIALAPNQAESYYQIGQMALDNGSYVEAQQECRKALEHNPKHGGALAALGIAAFRLKQYPEAIQSLQAAIAAAPDYQPAHYYYGLALAKTGQHEASEHEMKVAAQMAEDQNRREAQRLHLAPGASSGPPQP